MATTEIRNVEDILDSRDVIARIDWLESSDELDGDEVAELAALKELAEQGESACEDWSYGETLIHDTYFVAYAQELADDLGAVPFDAAWPLTCIDWEQAARELRMDYTSLEFAGQTYWAR